MRNLLKIERLLPSRPKIRLGKNQVVISDEYIFPTFSRKNITVFMDQCKSVNEKLTISGWGFTTETQKPLSRVFVAQNNRIIAQLSPSERVDVRCAYKLVYDNCGYTVTTEPLHPLYDGDTVCMLYATEEGLVAVNTRVSGQSKIIPIHSIVHKTDTDEVVITKPDGKKITTEAFKVTENFRAVIDSLEKDENHIHIKGWCFNDSNINSRLVVGLLGDEKNVEPLKVCDVSRPDVVSYHKINTKHDYYGFSITIKHNDKSEFKLALIDTQGDIRTAGILQVSA